MFRGPVGSFLCAASSYLAAREDFHAALLCPNCNTSMQAVSYRRRTRHVPQLSRRWLDRGELEKLVSDVRQVPRPMLQSQREVRPRSGDLPPRPRRGGTAILMTTVKSVTATTTIISATTRKSATSICSIFSTRLVRGAAVDGRFIDLPPRPLMERPLRSPGGLRPLRIEVTGGSFIDVFSVEPKSGVRRGCCCAGLVQ